MKQELIDLKCRLYGALLDKSSKSLTDITDSEINIMYELCKDRDIQNILEKAMKRKGQDYER